ncbi:MAG TPA: FAD:protein FMN transferase, partial [Rugosimonospora sp.]|nr:FAD:protein FMN transferase [Rugosimonospora sp.]
SELSRLNAAAGTPVRLSPDTFALVEAAVEAWRRTGGRFDPTVLAALCAAGYDRSFELVAADGPAASAPAPAVPGCGGIALQHDTGMVFLPPGVALDLGGIAKGHSADRAVAALMASGSAGAMADLGGDIRVAGIPPGDDGWIVAVDDPRDPGRDLAVLALGEGAVATSSSTRRRWTRAGEVFHHLIDPATAAPARRGVAAAVVVAGTAAWAEVLAKAALIAGPDEGPALLARSGAPGLLILDSGALRRCAGIEVYLR